MPIALTTGVPGSGKSLLTVAEDLAPQQDTRRLCIGGIPNLALMYEPIDVPSIAWETWTDKYGDVPRAPGEPPVLWVRRTDGGTPEPCGEDDDGAQPVSRDVTTWWLWCMPGDLIVVDECQDTLRPMPAGRRAPKFIRALEIHRHYGVDFVLITQHPGLIHSAVRALVGRHRHVRRLYGAPAATIYEWDHCSPPDRIRNATKRVWLYPRKSFDWYKSAVTHNKVKARVGVVPYALAAAVVAVPALWWYALGRGPAEVAGEQGVTPASASAAAPGQQPQLVQLVRTSAEFARAAMPVVPQRPETAPQYDALRVVVRMPRIQGGFCTPEWGCRCYITDGLRAPISAAACAKWVADPPFDPYFSPSEHGSTAAPSSGQPAPVDVSNVPLPALVAGAASR